MVLGSLRPRSITPVHIVPIWYAKCMTYHNIAICRHPSTLLLLHESNITDCAVAPPVTIPVPRRAPIYYDGSISSVTCKGLNDRSLGSRTNNIGTTSPLTLITRCGRRCCIVCIFMHSSEYIDTYNQNLSEAYGMLHSGRAHG